MMKYDKYSVITVLGGVYLLPLILHSLYGLNMLSTAQGWSLFALGLFLSLCGMILLTGMIFRWELEILAKAPKTSEISPEVTISSANELLQDSHQKNQELEELIRIHEQQQEALKAQLEQKDADWLRAEREYKQYREEQEQVLQNLAVHKNSSLEQLQQRDKAIQELQRTLLMQKESIEQFQQQILDLQNKETELNYEIKTLLQVSNIEKYSSYALDEELEAWDEEPVKSPIVVNRIEETAAFGPTLLLKQSLEMASKMTGVGSGRASSFSLENNVLDLRRLCDNLRMETVYGLILYSKKESKVVFANSQIKDLLGWAPEKFVQIFPEIIQNGFEEWRKGIQALDTSSKISLKVPMKNKDGRIITLECHLGAIENGIFHHHVLAVLS